MKQKIFQLGVGLYTTLDAARLLKISAPKIRRWLGGYSYQRDGVTREMPPLWKPELEAEDGQIELGFRDLMELRFVAAFIKAGISLQTIRNCLDHARECVDDDRPFLTRRFRTDGKTIFLESAMQAGDETLLDLKNNQYAIKDVIKETFKELDIVDDKVKSWRPFHGKNTIVVDPQYVFGQPMTAEYHIPTVTLAQAVQAEGSEKAVAEIYELPLRYVHDAVAYEQLLAA